jgi:hypothetical protein
MDLHRKVPRIDDILLVNTTVAILLKKLIHVCDLSPNRARYLFEGLPVLPFVRAFYSVQLTPDAAPITP